ncbi:hypothetical protein AB0395_32770 [Streptosporangium sp. NPDC051023]|uniref:hypothetical protein n=1 Tax=Streptosporangium sp. NPDC051023 TaxID=3155410 RepID=UPI00344B2E0C
MPYVEERKNSWRVRWKKADGTYTGGTTVNLETGEKFTSEEEAHQYGRDQETLIRLGLRQQKQGTITFGAWAGIWYSGLALEPTTMTKYRTMLQGHLLPAFEHRPLDDLKPEEMNPWERSIVRAGYAPRTAQDARDQMITILNAAVPRYLDHNPASRRRGTGRKGLKRIERARRRRAVWASPGEAIAIAERAALLAENDDVFLLLITVAFTGLRWAEAIGLEPDMLLPDGRLDIRQKLYELKGFYINHPKDGSLRIIHLPPFLLELLREAAGRARRCTCTGRRENLPPVDGEEFVEWCAGRRYLFLTPASAHYQRGNFGTHIMRPAADGVYPGRTGARARPPRPVLADVASYGPPPRPGRRGHAEAGHYTYPGRPVYWPWPYAECGQEFVPPSGRGRPAWPTWPLEEQPHLVSWRPIRESLTVHGLRHGHQTWMDDGGIKEALKKDRMGHEDQGDMSELYGHVAPQMVTDLLNLLQALWHSGVGERYRAHPRSAVPALDAALRASRRRAKVTILFSQKSPTGAAGQKKTRRLVSTDGL